MVNSRDDLAYYNAQLYNGAENGNGSGNGASANGVKASDGSSKKCALVISGSSLAFALKPELELKFLELACLCQAVICCRVTPLQKALVVELVKKHKDAITLSIGDGANDVSMIKTAHIGVGISGQEGMQAVLASDFAISQFRFLERLLLVHGRWSYRRMSTFLRYFFYKNFVYTICQFWFAFFSGYSAITLYDPMFITLYNTAYTTFPVMALGVFDQDVNAKNCVNYPKLYKSGINNEYFNKLKFLSSLVEGTVSSVVLFFIPYAVFRETSSPLIGGGPTTSGGLSVADYQTFGCVVATLVVITVNIRCAVDTSYWTWLNHASLWGSIVIYFFCKLLIDEVPFITGLQEFRTDGVATFVFGLPHFWLCLLLTSVMLILPVVAKRFYTSTIRPGLADRVRARQVLGRARSSKQPGIRPRGGVATKRRQSTRRRLAKSTKTKSGYAFAHQEGFGALITSGTLRQRPTTVRARARPRVLSASYSAAEDAINNPVVIGDGPGTPVQTGFIRSV